MQFFRHFLLLPYKIGIKERGFRSANFNKTFPKIDIETKQCYLQIGVRTLVVIRIFRVNNKRIIISLPLLGFVLVKGGRKPACWLLICDQGGWRWCRCPRHFPEDA